MTKIEVICGFLEGGKTTLIQNILDQDYMRDYRCILILQCEAGFTELSSASVKNKKIYLDEIQDSSKICPALFYKIQSDLNPDLILIEYNGTWSLDKLLRVRLPGEFQIDRILFCADASTIERYMKNTAGLMIRQLNNADAVLLNRCSGETAAVEGLVRANNRTATLCFDRQSQEDCLVPIFNPAAAKFENKRRKRRSIGIAAVFACLVLVLLFTRPLSAFFPLLQSVTMVFLGILMQAIPFLLIGAIVSAFLQVYVSDESLVRFFTGHPWLGFPLAIILGFFFPICDCGIVPIASRMTQKGVPLPQAMVFMLAAPAVNPVTIISTMYAFPGQPRYALFRIGLGVLIAVLTGIVLQVSQFRAEDVLLSHAATSCSCAADGCAPRHRGRTGRVESVLLISGQEFLGMGRYIIGGSLLCAVLQQTVPASVFRNSGSTALLAILLMLSASFFLSVCSTANAFIGRSFLNLFPPAAVMAFIVMGPMLDLSNLFMLGSSFKKKYIFELVGILLAIAVPVFLFLEITAKGALL